MYKNIPFIRFNHLWENKKVITNIFWESIVLNNNEFEDYLNNKLDKNWKLYRELFKKYFIKKKWYEENAIKEYKKRFWVNFIWPTLHIIVLTKWCNHQCKYCHASAKYTGEKNNNIDEKLMMNEKTAKNVVDIILQSPSNNLTIEFQWWEPLLNANLIDFIVNYTEKQNKKTKKNINYALVSNLTLINEEILEKLFSYPNFSISTSLDWDQKTHDFNRIMLNKNKWESSFMKLKEKILLIRKWEKQKGKKILYWAMWVITRKTLKRYKELVDTYIELGFNNIFLKKMNFFWFAKNTNNTIWYSTQELLEFYNNYFSYLVELYKKWIIIKEWYLNILLWKILNPEKINFMDLRSPCWAWIWQIAYDYTGNIYTCDEWRMIDNNTFLIWNTNNILEELIQNEIIWTMMDASTIESLPCDICAYATFCWVCPIESYWQRWNIYNNSVNDPHCKFFTYLFNWIFNKLSNKNTQECKFLMSQAKK